MSATESMPDLETLAAFIENRLSEDERRRVEERLARDEDFYEVYVETLRTLEELAQEAPEAPEEPAPGTASRFRPGRTWLAAAVPLAASILAVIWMLPRFGPGAVDPGRVDAGRHGAPPSGWHTLGLDAVTRGSGDEAWIALPFHLGVHHLDLEVALDHWDGDAVEHAAFRLRLELELHLFDTDPTFEDLRAWAADLDPDAPPSDTEVDAWRIRVEKRMETLVSRLDDAGHDAYRLGRWTESARLAALSRDRELLAERLRRLPAVRRTITELHGSAPLPPAVEEALRELDALDAAGSPDPDAAGPALKHLLLGLGGDLLDP